MLRRLFGNETSIRPDPVAAVERLLRRRSAAERSHLVLEHLVASFDGDVRGFTVVRRPGGDEADTRAGTRAQSKAESSYAFEAEVGYGAGLLAIAAVNGPWRAPGPRLVGNIVQEMFTSNSAEIRRPLSDLGLRNAQGVLVAPISGSFHDHGALVLMRHNGGGFDDGDLAVAERWASLLGEAHSRDTELRRAKLSLVEFSKAFVQAMEAQDFAQLGHGERVTAYALAMGRTLELSRQEQVDLYFAAMLHDIGKLGNGLDLAIEDSEHPDRGANMVASAGLLAGASAGIRSHHESWDGSGFPNALRKEDIPLLARIVAVADAFDILSSERGQALPLSDVEHGLEARSGQQLDPALVSLFINILRQGKSTQELARLGDSDLPF